ncbi:MAG: NTPase (NACHT family) [Cyanobacteria bacterium QH_7_48_89]|nr:MAG: NTPase (NACHT family) [Cyanobacteria bacterium QH_7_48_89]
MVKRAKRSLQASPEGIERANQAVLNFATKIDFAAELEISRTTVQNFFAGKSIGRENFHKICQKLGLPWQEVAELPEGPAKEPEKPHCDRSPEIDPLVRAVRHQGHAQIKQKCESMRVLDMSKPIRIDDIYTHVNVLEKISGRQRYELTDLHKISVSEEFDRLGFGQIVQDRVPGLEAVQRYQKLIILGKPGTGKTIFLKHLALQCSNGIFQAHQVPVYISLKEFAETEPQLSLLEYIHKQLSTESFTNTDVTQQLLEHGRLLILLDGLDEVKKVDSRRVCQAVHQLAVQFHANHFVISCRIAAREYALEQFSEVEIANFGTEEITNFATQWFTNRGLCIGEQFSQKLRENSSIRELAKNPLLLTLLCLVFEELADFPSNRAELYQEGLHLLLKKWDAKRNIEREQFYKDLSVRQKEDLLSHIASITFKRGDYFFKQTELEQHIADYIGNLPGANRDLEALHLDSEAVLKSIEAQHGILVERAKGIYSFSHLTFQEYFTAREIVASPNSQALDTSLQELVSHLTDSRWREVFLLTAGMLRNADHFLQLMKHRVDQLVASDSHLQAFLSCIIDKSQAVATSYKPATVRAFFFELHLARILNLVGSSLTLSLALNSALTRTLTQNSDLALDLNLDRLLGLTRIFSHVNSPNHSFDRLFERALSRASEVSPKLWSDLKELREQLPQTNASRMEFEVWWRENGQAWSEQLRSTIFEHRSFGYCWQFSEQQRETLKSYHYATRLLVDCMNSECNVTPTVREEIEKTLLLSTIDTETKLESLPFPMVKSTTDA